MSAGPFGATPPVDVELQAMLDRLNVQRKDADGFSEYTKRPVTIKAQQWFPGVKIFGVVEIGADNMGMIYTLEGPMKVSPGDYVIIGVKGEMYPCKPDIFAATYEGKK